MTYTPLPTQSAPPHSYFVCKKAQSLVEDKRFASIVYAKQFLQF